MVVMLQLLDLPDAKVLSKFADRYPNLNVQQVIGFLTLLRVGSDLSAALDRYLAEHELLQGRWWVLILLMREDDYRSSPSLLAEKAGVSRATMSGLIDGLARENLVSRVVDNADRRKQQIKLTEKGQAKLDEVMPEYYRRVESLMQILSAEQCSELTGLLANLKSNITAFK